MAFWNRSGSPQRKAHRQQIEEYGLEKKPFTKGLLLSALAQIEVTGSEEECRWKDLDHAILNSAITVNTHVTMTAMKANGLMLLLTRGVVIKQPKVRAIIAFNTFVQFCLLSRLTEEGVTINSPQINALALRTLFLALSEDEWNRVILDLSELCIETVKELSREDEPNLVSWKKTMHTFISSYILSYNEDSPRLQVLNYPWVFDQHLRMFLKAAEG
ncbi:MAG: hypothetical protein OJF52_000683 [Nitrospira sp.]|jgi:hypothetical protein|nr:MAG: hypothetical protein OJF52_000683 [Nitrospira sp.]